MKNFLRHYILCFSILFSTFVFAQSFVRTAEIPVPSNAMNWGKNDSYEVLFRDGATGSFALDKTVQRNGAPSLRLSKTNAIGYIEVRTTKATLIKLEQRTTLRGFFHAQNAPLSSLLL